MAERDRLRREVADLQSELDQWRIDLWVPPGHYYSPIPSKEDVRRRENVVFDVKRRELPGIDLNEPGQLQLLESLKTFYVELSFPAKKSHARRYYFENGAFEYADAIALYCMIRHLKPRRIIEAGSGFSSALILDTNELHFTKSISCTFIEPNPELLLSLIKPADRGQIELLQKPLQEVDRTQFEQLTANDILFIDSTHVSKIDSDVNYIMFQILPALQPGVYIHFHDIFYPFEYPMEWIYEGRAWNEAYLLRAFLQYNGTFQIQYFNSFLGQFHADRLGEHMPLCMKNTGGSIWIRKR